MRKIIISIIVIGLLTIVFIVVNKALDIGKAVKEKTPITKSNSNELPLFELLTLDNVPYSKYNLKKNQSLIIVYFDPDCDLCEKSGQVFNTFKKAHESSQVLFVSHSKDSYKEIEDINNIEIKDLSFSYPGQDFLITNANLLLSKGKITFLKGKSGSGKSTLTQLLLKLYKQNSGTITVNNKLSLDDFNSRNWRDQIAYVPQNIKIFNDSALYNISLDDKLPKDKIIDFCENYLEISDIFSKLKDSYWTILGEEGVTPSGGEKQIIAIARALFSKPKILILDEATASMDKATQSRVLKLLNKLKSEMVILFITHNEQLSSENTTNNYLLKDKVISLQQT